MDDTDFDPNEPEDPKESEVDSASAADGEGENEYDGAADDEAAPPCHLSIVVEKPGKMPGALSILASTQDGTLVVDNMFYFEDAKLAHTLGRSANPEDRDNSYPGPTFGTLDEDLQMLIERYLEERGVTQALAVFVPDYLDVKEQKEYVRWLNNVKGFIDA
jgi:complement component 1 Q subcomponent-binding protein, mitochondrial